MENQREIAIAQLVKFCRAAKYPYAEVAVESDLPMITSLGQLAFGKRAFGVDKFRSLFAVNPNILWKVRDNGHIKGYLDIIPVRSEFAEGLIAGTKKEAELQPSDVIPDSELGVISDGYIYVAAVVAASALNPGRGPKATDKTFAKLASAAFDRIQQIGNKNPAFTKVISMAYEHKPGTEGLGTPYLMKLGFEVVGKSGEEYPVCMLDLHEVGNEFADVFLEISRRRSERPEPAPSKPPSELMEFLLDCDSLDLAHTTIVGECRRTNPQTITSLKLWAQKIARSLKQKTEEFANFIVWAAPGSGKTYFVQQIAESLGGDVLFREINFAALDQSQVEEKLQEIRKATSPVLVLYDEIDARPTEKWPYDVAFNILELNKNDPARRVVFVLVGSTPPGREAMIEGMRKRVKGQDLLDRVPVDNQFDIPSMTIADRAMVVATQATIAAREQGTNVDGIDKMAMYFALGDRYKSPRQLTQLVKPAVERMPPGDSVLHYLDLFVRKDVRALDFWTRNTEVIEALRETHIRLELPPKAATA